MQARLDLYSASPSAIKALVALDVAASKLGIETSLLDLVKLRASQINGCAYCVDLHASEAKTRGETERRLHAVIVWREAPFFTERERAALAWTEAITLVSETHAPDGEYASLRNHFSESEMVELTLAIGVINVWNRLAIGFRKLPAA